MSFAASAMVGTAAGNDPFVVIFRSTIIMIVCWFIGFFIGTVAVRAVNESITAYKEAHPIPSEDDDDAPVEDEDDSMAPPQEAVSSPGVVT